MLLSHLLQKYALPTTIYYSYGIRISNIFYTTELYSAEKKYFNTCEKLYCSYQTTLCYGNLHDATWQGPIHHSHILLKNTIF